MWVKLYGTNSPKGIPAEWPMAVIETGERPGPEWIEMDKKEYSEYREKNEAKYAEYERSISKPVETADVFTPEQRAEILKMIRENPSIAQK